MLERFGRADGINGFGERGRGNFYGQLAGIVLR